MNSRAMGNVLGLTAVDIVLKLRIIHHKKRRVHMKPRESTLLSSFVRASLVCRVCLAIILLAITLIWAEWPGVGENLPICVASGEQYIPQIVSDGHDGCVIIWFDARNGMSLINVFGQRVSAQGDTLWASSGVQLTNVPSYSWISYLVACGDNNGGAFFAWEDPRDGNFDVYVQHVDSTGATLWTYNGIRLSMTSDDDFVMDITPDETGGCIVAWNTAGATEIIIAQRVNATGVKVWDTAGVVVSTGTSNATRAQIEGDGHGGIVACWLDGRYHPAWNEFKDIYAQRIDSLGSVCWVDTSVALHRLGNAPFYSFPELVSNGSGRFFVAWYDWRSGGFDIYAQCVSDSGQVLWTANGNTVCANPGDQTGPRIAAGFPEGLFCAWYDAYTNIRAQRLDASGAMLWPSSGVVAVSSSSDLILGSAFRTSNGFYAVVYGEYVGSTTNELVKAQALDASGNLIWNAGGEPVSTVVSPKSNIEAIPDTCGGVITVWRDDRNGSYASDIFAQRVDPQVGIVTARPFPNCISSVHCAPNPFRNSTLIRYGLNRTSSVILNIYDITGCRIRTLLCGIHTAGLHELTWDARDDNGAMLPDGVYFLSLETTGEERVVSRVILVK